MAIFPLEVRARREGRFPSARMGRLYLAGEAGRVDANALYIPTYRERPEVPKVRFVIFRLHIIRRPRPFRILGLVGIVDSSPMYGASIRCIGTVGRMAGCDVSSPADPGDIWPKSERL